MRRHHLFAIAILLLALVVPTAHAQAHDMTLFSEDSAVSSLAGFEGKLFMLKEDGLYCYDIPTQAETCISELISSRWEAVNRIDYLLASGGQLYGFNAEQMKLTELDDVGGQYVKGDATTFDSLLDDQWVSPMLEGGKLLYLKESDHARAGTAQEIIEIDILTKEEMSTPAKGILLLSGYKDDQYLGLSTSRNHEGVAGHQLVTIDRGTGAVQLLCELDRTLNLAAIAYDPLTDIIYGINRGNLYIFGSDLGAPFHSSITAGDIRCMTIIGDGVIGLAVDSSVMIKDTGLDGRGDRQTLTVQDPYGRAIEYKDFIQSHPAVTLAFSAKDALSNEDRFVQDMLSRSSSIDVYILQDKNLISTIYAKGYGADLSSSKTLQGLADDMVDAFNTLLVRDGQLLIYPKKCFVTMMGYNPQFFEEFGFDIPTTYDQLLDLTSLWYDDYAYEHPDIYFNPFDNGLDLLSLLQRYADEMAKNELDLHYDDAPIIKTIQHYRTVHAQYLQSTAHTDGGTWTTHAFKVLDVLASGQFEYLPLTFQVRKKNWISLICTTRFTIRPRTQRAPYISLC